MVTNSRFFRNDFACANCNSCAIIYNTICLLVIGLILMFLLIRCICKNVADSDQPGLLHPTCSFCTTYRVLFNPYLSLGLCILDDSTKNSLDYYSKCRQLYLLHYATCTDYIYSEHQISRLNNNKNLF
jgi:hypothetical protein